WLRDHRGFLEFFFSNVFSEPHSTKQIEDCVAWGLDTTPETLADTTVADGLDEAGALDLCRKVRCPVLVIQGSRDRITGPARGVELAQAIPGARLVMLEGSGHGPQGRDPVRVNLLIRDFVDRVHPPAAPERRWVRGKSRAK